ncbi:cell division protein FtsA [Lachnospiraceae bacterium]|jgi:cell division protein FtsA|nr:cell division protein FtsA [Lachnospiraceae bacterium]GFI65170.1 cell division protein FtsA [Lachnospiraceae bacterium]
MAGVREGQGQLVFGLDIGTRSIVGTVGYLSGGKFHVLAQRSREHETRSMLDGQIHDIGKVGQTICQVKEQLEDDLNRKLTEVCIAAAGRVLRTVTTHAEQSFDEEHVVTEEDVYSLSTIGVEQAYEEFVKNNDTDMKFYCVGYTPMRYYMNGYQIGNLEEHKVRNMAVDLIATFLPDDVVDGLYKAVELAGLHVANLTLEPIAAIQVAIPEKFRMLNMALVDVGAGTSDISITKDGTITAYGMIPVAGDSLTDIIVQHCLVDFDTAERIKRQTGTQESVEYQDIMGLTQVINASEVAEILSGHVQEMVKQVAACIRELNGDKSVSAVFVVGGGGMIPGYTDALAKELDIVKERVAIRGQEVMQSIVFEVENPRRDSMMVTPIGICLSYYEQSNNFIFVEFNGRRVKLYDNGKLSVADAAVQSDFSNEELFPRRGKALTFTVNGKSRMVRGIQGEAAVIRVNGEPADIYSQVHNGDHIDVVSSTAGDAAVLELGRLPELTERLHVYVNGTRIDLPKTAAVNGRLENEFYSVREGDEIRIQNFYTVREVAEFMDVPLGGKILVNDTPARPETRVYENFTLSWDVNAEVSFADLEEETEEEAALRRAAKEAAAVQEASVSVDAAGTAVTERQTDGLKTDGRADTAEEEVSEQGPVNMTVIVNRYPVICSGKSSYVFVDVFSFIDFDLNASAGRAIVTKLNGRNAEYMEPLKDGDVIEIYWEELNS